MGCTQSSEQKYNPRPDDAPPKESVPTHSHRHVLNHNSKGDIIDLELEDEKMPYDFTDQLGKGSYGTVMKAAHKDKPGCEFACKVILKERLEKSKDGEEMLFEEVEILQSTNHPHVIRVYDLWEDVKSFYVVMEYMKGGDVFSRVVKEHRYTEQHARYLSQTLLQVLAYLHKGGIVHRDLKPDNLLLMKDNDFDIKLADFGFATRLNGGLATRHCGTPTYVAPEILQNKEYGTSVDIWSAGVIIYVLLGGYPPFFAKTQLDLFRLIKRGKFEFHKGYWDHVSQDAIDFIRAVLVVDPLKRPTAEQLLQHRWMQVEDKVLMDRDLDMSKMELKKYNARRKFRAAVEAVMAVDRFHRVMLEMHKDYQNKQPSANNGNDSLNINTSSSLNKSTGTGTDKNVKFSEVSAATKAK